MILRRLLPVLTLGLLAACAPVEPPPAPPPPAAAKTTMALTAVVFADLPGWSEDSAADVLPALLKSCDALARLPTDRSIGHDGIGGTVADWLGPCAAARRVPAGDHAAARTMFERQFAPWRVTANGQTEGMFTGYFEPEIQGSRRRQGRFTHPVHGRPSDLVSVDLGRFRPDLAGETLAGRVENGRLLPYPPRAEIEAGAIDGRAPVLVWTDDPVDLAIMHIQGSGRVRLDDGEVIRLGVAATNGQRFIGIGKTMIEDGLLSGDGSMPAIRAWLKAHPDRAGAILARNPRYVFYAVVQGDGPLGTAGVALTPHRSLAVDPRHIPLGAPVWIDTRDPAGRPLRRLMMAQDTGAAIKGPIRGDIFWGSGEAAFLQAGRMKNPGGLVLLLPLTRSPRLAFQQ